MKTINHNPAWKKGLKHFRHGFELVSSLNQSEEIHTLLEGWGLERDRQYRFGISEEIYWEIIASSFPKLKEIPLKAILSFRSKKMALLFKLTWEEMIPTSNNQMAFYTAMVAAAFHPTQHSTIRRGTLSPIFSKST